MTGRTFAFGDKVTEREPFYVLGAGVVVVGEVVGTRGPDCLVRGLRLPESDDPAEPLDWDDCIVFDPDELRRFRPGRDKPYVLSRSDIGSLREREPVA